VNGDFQRGFRTATPSLQALTAQHELRPVLVLPPKIFCPLRFYVAYPDILEHNERPPHLPLERHTRLSIAHRSRNGVGHVASAAAIVPSGLSLRPRRSPPLPMLESYQTRHQVLEVLQG
jgi:hypothetical protein